MADSNTADSHIDHAASLKYWNSVPATPGSMLGEFPSVSRIDLQGSKNFLSKIRRLIPGVTSEGKFKQGMDGGAGVGRVTEGFLSHVCEVVDAVEPIAKFTKVMEESQLKRDGVIGTIYTRGLESWTPEKKYDLIWVQWCVGHLTDSQLIDYTVRCRNALTDDGLMVVKENLSTHFSGRDMYDQEDSSVTRTDAKFRQIFNAAGMEVVKAELQKGFPKSLQLLPVQMYALRPKTTN
jgi:protein N-terminal methyltransferase